MSNKTLLSEAQIRQFMKLAKLEPLTPGFVHGLAESAPYLEEEDDLEAELHATEDELGHEDDIADEEGDELDAMEELPVEAPALGGAEKMISVSDLLTALEDALEAVTGEEVSAEMDDDMEVEDELEADLDVDAADDMEADTEMGMDDDMVAEAVTKGSDAEEDESLGMEDGKEADKDMSEKGRRKVARADARKDESTEATDDLVEQITKRVAARILKSALAKK
jgi:hypothetical protein